MSDHFFRYLRWEASRVDRDLERAYALGADHAEIWQHWQQRKIVADQLAR